MTEKEIAELEAAYHAYRGCTIGSVAPVHAIMSGGMILDRQPTLADRVVRGVYYVLTTRVDGTVSLTELQ